MKSSNFKERFTYAINNSEYNNSDIAKKIHVSKSTITAYLKGEYEAKQDKVYILSKIFDVNPAWLMGYDVPMKLESDIYQNQNLEIKFPKEFLNLSEQHQKEMIADVEIMIDALMFKYLKKEKENKGGENG